MTEGGPAHTTTRPLPHYLLTHPLPSPGSNLQALAKRSVETNGEGAARRRGRSRCCAVKGHFTPHLAPLPRPHLPPLSLSLTAGGVGGGVGVRWPTLLDLLRYQLAAALKCQQSAPCLLEGISLVCESQPQDSCGPGERH